MATYTTNYNLKKPDYSDTRDVKELNDNMDIIDTQLANRKTKQTAKTDPTASGTGIDFIDSISQDANGEITATKKTVRTASKGNTGLCPALPDENTTKKFLRQDGSFAEIPVSNTNNSLSWGSSVKIAEVNGEDINAKLPSNPNTWRGVQIKQWIAQYSISSGGAASITASSFSAVVPTGYTAAGVLKIATGDSNVDVARFDGGATGSSEMLKLRHKGSSGSGGFTATAYITVLYLQNS